MVTETSAAGLVTRFGYDAAGRQTSVTSPRGHITRTEYSPRGEVTREIAPTGATKLFAFDPAGNLTTATDANGGVTRYAYDAVGNRMTMTDAKGAVTAFVYDAARRRTAVTDPLGRITTFAYDTAGRITLTMDPSGRSTTVVYDAAGQVTQRTYGDGSTETFSYDAAGRRTQMTDATGATRFAYDPAGRLISTTHPDGSVVSMAYDPAGNRTSLTYPDATAATFSYDQANRLVSLTHSVAGAATYGLDADGRLAGESLPDGMTRSLRYDGGLLDRFIETRRGSSVVTTLTRDAADRIVAETTNNKTRRYSYDAAGQLTRVDDPGDGHDAAYSYDAVGNRVSETRDDDTTSYTYDAASQLTQRRSDDGATAFEFDPAGRLISEANGERSVTRSYDVRGLLAQKVAIDDDSRATTSYSHDADGTLTRLDITTAGDDGDDDEDSGSRPETKRYVLRWDGGGMGDVLTRGRDGKDTDLIYGYGRALAASGGAGISFSYDAYGSALQTPPSKDLVAAKAYDAFGNPSTDLDQDPLFGYRSELHIGDDIHLRARNYNPALGRFTTVDPFGDQDGEVHSAAGYQYARNDPLNTGDASGLTPVRDAGLRAASSLPTPTVSAAAVGRVTSQGPVGGPTVSTQGPVVSSTIATALAALIARLVASRQGAVVAAGGCVKDPPTFEEFLTGKGCVPNGFVKRFGYTPKLVNTKAGKRMIKPRGECSWAPDTGAHYDFQNACKTHDYAYDLRRWANEGHYGITAPRLRVDLFFKADMYADCSGRGWFSGPICRRTADTFYSFVRRFAS